MVSIFKSISKYLEKSPDKNRFLTEQISLIAEIKINELLKLERTELFLLGDTLIFLTSVSPKVNCFLDKLEYEDEKVVNLYCNICDKYLSHNENVLNVTMGNYLTKPSEEFRLSHRTSMGYLDRTNKKYEDVLKERENLLKIISELEKEISKEKEKSSKLENTNAELESKYKDFVREFDLLRRTSKTNILVQEELLQDSIKMTEFKNIISEKDMLIEDMKRDHLITVKSLNEIINSLNDKVEVLEDKLTSFKSLSAENDKLKTKLKELSYLRDRQSEFDELSISLESKNRKIDSLLKEKQNLISQIEKSNKEVLSERDKFRQLDYARKKVESELKELKKEFSQLETKLKETQTNHCSIEIKRPSISETQGNLLVDIERTSLPMADEDNFTSDLENLKFVIKNLNAEISCLTAEKEKLLNQIEAHDIEFKKLMHENDKVQLEKDKLNLQIQKIELDREKSEMKCSNEKKKLEDDLKELQDKYKKLLSVDASGNKSIVSNDLKLYEEERERFSSNNFNSDEDCELFKLEIKNLRTSLLQKEEMNKHLQNKLQMIDGEKKQLNSHIKDSVNKFNGDIFKRSEDLEFYKRSYEEQKNRVDREHELISSSLYELALQFMSLKSELNKKVNTSNPNKNWLEAERNKNFPLDNK